jgi:hypothetical protein
MLGASWMMPLAVYSSAEVPLASTTDAYARIGGSTGNWHHFLAFLFKPEKAILHDLFWQNGFAQ